jgi:hypothetical protein
MCDSRGRVPGVGKSGEGGLTTQWTEQLVDDICDHLASGKSLLEVGKLKGYPSSATMYRQMMADEAFAARIARAREAQQDHEADLCVQMADSATPEDWQQVKLRIWARQWRAAKLAPKRYGEKQTLEHTGANGGPVQYNDSEAAAKLAALMEAARARRDEG